MNTVHATFAVAEDTYRRDRASQEFRTAGGSHHVHRFGGWRERRRAVARAGAAR